jgi:arsenate reductase
MSYRVLFLCLKNSARSQMAEAIANKKSDGHFIAYSAGSVPAESVHPLALKVLTESGFDVTQLRTKSLEEYKEIDFDFIITLCDSMKEICPVFPGRPIYAHWGMPDPAEFEGSDEDKLRFFKKTLLEINQRIILFNNIPFDKLDRRALELKVKEIGEAEL